MSRAGIVLNFRGGPFDGQCHELPLGKRGTLDFQAKGQQGRYELKEGYTAQEATFLHWVPTQQKAA